MKRVLSVIGNAVLTLALLAAALLTGAAAAGKLTNRHPQLCGYALSRIMSGSMRAGGFEIGEYVITGYASETDLRCGDVIAYYRDAATKKPLSAGDDRQRWEVVLHEIVEIKREDGRTLYVTKGSSNTAADAYPVPYASVMGRYIPMNKTAMQAVGFVAGGNAFVYWLIVCAVALGLKQVMKMWEMSEDKQTLPLIMAAKTKRR